VLVVGSFKGANCDHYLAVKKVRKRLAVIKQTIHRYMEKFNLKKLIEVEGNIWKWQQ
jgi:hypothetical protein